MKICAIGYPPISDRNFRVFEEMAKYIDVYAILPEKWKGKEVFSPPPSRRVKVITTKAYVYHSTHLVGGFLKGIMPFTYFHLSKLKSEIDLIYTVAEPYNSQTLYNSTISKYFDLKHVFFTYENIIPEKKGYLAKFKQYIRDAIQRKSIANSDGIIAGNLGAKKIMINLGARNDRISVLPQTGVDIGRFSRKMDPHYRKKLGLEDKKIILFAGLLSKSKGVDVLVDAIPSTIKEEKKAHFIICGTGPLERKLKEEIEEKNLKEYVTFLEWVPYEKMPELHASADIFTYPSIPTPTWEEQFGYSMVEAMACGKPVVATNSGSIPEVVADEVTGLLVPPGNPLELARALKELISGNELREKMGKRARKRVEDNYSIEVVAKKTAEFLKFIAES
jgi:glycosyltransferase involved in cell wall biosynthesis